MKEPTKTCHAFEVSGQFALFATPDSKLSGDKTSYPVPTYEALAGICKSIYWKPSFEPVIDAVRVMSSIRMEERKMLVPKISGGAKDLAWYTYLKDVRYQVLMHIAWNGAHPELAEDRNYGKHNAIMERAIRAGGRRNVFLGKSECIGYVAPCEFGEGAGAFDHTGTIPFGRMFHSFLYRDRLPDGKAEKAPADLVPVLYDDIVMTDGVIWFKEPAKIPYGKEDLAPIRLFSTGRRSPGTDYTMEDTMESGVVCA